MTSDKPESIDELFRRDYSTWEQPDVERMIETLRAHRVKLGNLDEKPKRATAAKVDLSGLSPEDMLKKLGLTT